MQIFTSKLMLVLVVIVLDVEYQQERILEYSKLSKNVVEIGNQFVLI